MAIQRLEGGGVLVTGGDLNKYFDKILNRRNNYEKNCSFCKHEVEDTEIDCSECSLYSGEISCSCHINPPCSKCTDSLFEVSDYLINYERYYEYGKKRWECYRSEKKTFEKLATMELDGFTVNAETLRTGAIAIYVTKMKEDYDIDICKKHDFKTKMSKLINNFNLQRMVI